MSKNIIFVEVVVADKDPTFGSNSHLGLQGQPSSDRLTLKQFVI